MATEHWFPRISDAYEAFLLDAQARHLASTTLEYYHYRLGPFVCGLGETTVDAVTSTHIRRFLAEMSADGLSGYSVLGYARAIRAFFNFCVREEWLDASPMSKVRMPRIERREPQVYSRKQIRAILDACTSARDKAVVLFLLDTGVRASELINLDLGHVDMKSGAVRIVLGKGRKGRTVYLGAKARKELLHYLMRRHNSGDDDPIWLSQTGERLTRSGLVQLLRRIGKRAGLRCTAHGFRRTFATVSLRSGMDIYTLQRLMGHEDITVLKHYVAVAQVDIEAAQRRFGVVDHII